MATVVRTGFCVIALVVVLACGAHAFSTNFHKYEVFLKTNFCATRLLRKVYSSKSLCLACASQDPINATCMSTATGPFAVVPKKKADKIDDGSFCNNDPPFLQHRDEFFNAVDVTDLQAYPYLAIEGVKRGTIPSNTLINQVRLGNPYSTFITVHIFDNIAGMKEFYNLPQKFETSRLFDHVIKTRRQISNSYLDVFVIMHEGLENLDNDNNWCNNPFKYLPLHLAEKTQLEYFLCNEQLNRPDLERVLTRFFPNAGTCNSCLTHYGKEDNLNNTACISTEGESGYVLNGVQKIDSVLPSFDCSAEKPFVRAAEGLFYFRLDNTGRVPFMLKRCKGEDMQWQEDAIFLLSGQNFTLFNDSYRHCRNENELFSLVSLNDIYNGQQICNHHGGRDPLYLVSDVTTTELPTLSPKEREENEQVVAGTVVGVVVPAALVGSFLVWASVRIR